MERRSYQDAVQALRSRLGGRWEGVELAGRDEMIEVLKDRLGYDTRAANDAIDAMIAAGTLRYHRAHEAGAGPGVVPAPLTPPGEGMATGVPASGGLAGAPIAPGAISAIGYWQVGEEQDEAPPGRAGQVDPTE